MKTDMDNMIKELTPLQVVGLYVQGALVGSWRMWPVRWDWNTNSRQANIIARCLQDFGITEDIILNTKEYRELLKGK